MVHTITFRWEKFSSTTVKAVEDFVVGQHRTPAAIGALVQEGVRAANELSIEVGGGFRAPPPHRFEGAPLDLVLPASLVNLDPKERSHPAHLRIQVTLHVVVVNEQHVRLTAVRPEGRDVLEPLWVLIDTPREEHVHVINRRRRRTGAEIDAVLQQAPDQVGQLFDSQVTQMVLERHDRIPTVPPHHDVTHGRMPGNSIGHGVGLEGSAVRLRLEQSDDLVDRLEAASNQGAISITGPGAPSGKSSVATIACIHVVPHFAGVHTTMSPGRKAKRSQRRLSDITLRYSRSIG